MIYQATKEDGTPEWVYFDGQSKQRFATEGEARTAELEARMSERPTAAQEWETQLRLLIDTSRGLITQAQALSLLAQTNDITQVIGTTADGAVLEGTTITKEDAFLRAQLFGELQTWLNEHSTGSELTRLAILFRRF